jgi:hypothetical protein
MNELKASFALTDAERAGPLWEKLAAHFQARISKLHMELENATDENTSARLRGRIATFRELLVHDKDSPPVN